MKILIVDDESAVKSLFKQRFKQEIKDKIFEFEFAFSAEEAINSLKDPKTSDVLLMLADINMPGLSGLQLAKLMKEEFPHIRVIMLTAYGDIFNSIAAKEYGVTNFFVKPIDFQLLKEKLLEIQSQKIGN
ncbi:MAG: response regulator [Parachlamydiaceae bacterium]|nr:response regulator [Parachlamydiaceae bacterium]